MKANSQYLPALALALFFTLIKTAIASPTQLDNTSQTNHNHHKKPEKFNNLIRQIRSVQLFNRAIAIAEKIDNLTVKIDTLSEIGLQLAQAQQRKHSQAVFAQAIKLIPQIQGDEYNQYDYEQALRNITIKLAQAGFIETAIKFAEQIPSNIIKAQVFNQISLILTEQGERQQAQTLLDKALKFVDAITENYEYQANGSCANYKHEVLSQIAANLSLQAQIDRALQIAKNMTGCTSASGESTQDYQAWAFLGILNQLQQTEVIRNIWKQAQTISFPHEKAQVWSEIAVKMVDRKDPDLALVIANKLAAEIPIPTEITSGFDLITFWTRENHLAKIAIKLAETKNLDAALTIAAKMTDNTQSLPEMLQTSLPILSPKVKVLSAIAKQMVVANNTSQALQLANTIPEENPQTLVKIAIATALEDNGQKTQADEILQTLSLPTKPTKTGELTNYQGFSEIAIALVSAKRTDTAIQIANSINNQIDRESTLTDIALQLADLGEIDAALNLIKQLEGVGSQQSIFKKVITQLIKTNKLERALPILASLVEQDPQLSREIAEKFAQQGNQNQAMTIAETIEDTAIKAKTLAAIALLNLDFEN